jgi:hypothetical protein
MKYINFTQDDKIVETSKVTTGYFTGGVGTLAGTNLVTASLAAGQKEYYYNLQYSSADQLSVTYGHKAGSGSNDTIGQTQAIYGQLKTILLDPTTIDNDFILTGSSAENDVYAISFERARMTDRINKKNWTLQLSGSTTTGGGSLLHLTDDSSTIASVSTPVGPRYNVVSGSGGAVAVAASTTKYGWLYPNVGIMLLSATRLSASIPGTVAASTSGFAPDPATDGTADNAFSFFSGIQSGSQTFRSEEDQATTSYFCRLKARDFNFSNNPTFTSGSTNEFRNLSFEGNPQTFITTVGLYTSTNELVAVARLSTPVQKNYSSETVVKVNLTY